MCVLMRVCCLRGSCAAISYTRIAEIIPSAANCPAPWVYDATADVSSVDASYPPGACVAPPTVGAQCHSVFFHPPLNYVFLRGTVIGTQFGSPCAFGPVGRTQSLNGERLLFDDLPCVASA